MPSKGSTDAYDRRGHHFRLFFFAFLTGPYCLRAFASHPAPLALPLSFRQALSAFCSFCARVSALTFAQPEMLIEVSSLIFTPFCARNSVGILRFCPQRLPWSDSGRFEASAANSPCGR